MATAKEKKSEKSTQMLQKSWQFHDFLLQNGAIFWDKFPKITLTILLGKFLPQKKFNGPVGGLISSHVIIICFFWQSKQPIN
jgi:hypothetical protein